MARREFSFSDLVQFVVEVIARRAQKNVASSPGL